MVALIRRVFLPALDDQLNALGALPFSNESDTWNLDLRYEIPTRSGAIVSTILFGKGVRTNYTNKPDNPAAGDWAARRSTGPAWDSESTCLS